MKATNISKGPRGLNSTNGPILVEPGESVEIDLNEVELKVSKGTGWFEFEGEAADAGDKLDRDELKKQADELGLQYAPNIKSEKLKELIDAKLAS
ncbi:hypothetical protein [Agrobacterium sp. SUL3]|uniref:hypothetical protein n=1 Tax=Agrobacterium sp. SUL3 TaxID=1701910 RepID=UPI00069965F9|nr:hypothetical protein [Agrobacterium sp. SUL3]KNY36091.1 hypothetical protein AKG12_03625 [Agrobacterium sp. SUL3]